MAVVRNLAAGYYGIETDGVQISPAVNDAIQRAFQAASEIPAKALRISLADRSVESDTRRSFPEVTADRE